MSDERSGSCERKVRTLLCIGISRRENYLLSFNADVSFTIGHVKERLQRPQANTGDTAATSVVFIYIFYSPYNGSTDIVKKLNNLTKVE